MVVLPKSVTPARIEANFTGASGAYSKLTAEDVAQLDGVATGGKQRRLIMPPWGKWRGPWPYRLGLKSVAQVLTLVSRTGHLSNPTCKMTVDCATDHEMKHSRQVACRLQYACLTNWKCVRPFGNAICLYLFVDVPDPG
jgi:hypothetical protein